MKNHLLPALKLTVICAVLFCGLYPLSVWCIAQFAPGQGSGVTLTQQGNKYYQNVGQSFTADKYFWSRPSAVDYDAAGSGGSNKGPTNPEYLAAVQAAIDTFMAHNPGIGKADIPADLVTASGSGLDPHISIMAATVQVKRIAQVRNLPEAKLLHLIDQHTEKPLLGLLGTTSVNVLTLNLALDNL